MSFHGAHYFALGRVPELHVAIPRPHSQQRALHRPGDGSHLILVFEVAQFGDAAITGRPQIHAGPQTYVGMRVFMNCYSIQRATTE
jgi:hypothetical protein